MSWVEVIRPRVLPVGQVVAGVHLMHQIFTMIDRTKQWQGVGWVMLTPAVTVLARAEGEVEIKLCVLVIANAAVHVWKIVVEKRLVGNAMPAFLKEVPLSENDQLFVGAEELIEKVEDGLSSKSFPSVLLLGRSGTGKSAVIKECVRRTRNGQVKKDSPLFGKRILMLDSNVFTSDIQHMGQFSDKCVALLAFLKRNPDVIVYIEEIHSVLKEGSHRGNLASTFANKMKQPLEAGEIQIIAATTQAEFEKFVGEDAAFVRRMPPVTVKEVTDEECLDILKAKRPLYPEVPFTEEQLRRLVEVSHETGELGVGQPSKAVTLMDHVAIRCKKRGKTFDEAVGEIAKKEKASVETMSQLPVTQQQMAVVWPAFLQFLQSGKK